MQSNMQTDNELLQKFRDTPEDLRLWSREDKLRFLKMYAIFVRNESIIYDLVYGCQFCDSFEDIFRDYDEVALDTKTQGVDYAVKCLQEIIDDDTDDDDTGDEDTDDNKKLK